MRRESNPRDPAGPMVFEATALRRRAHLIRVAGCSAGAGGRSRTCTPVRAPNSESGLSTVPFTPARVVREAGLEPARPEDPRLSTVDVYQFQSLAHNKRTFSLREPPNKSVWCRERDSNPHAQWAPLFESGVSTDSSHPGPSRAKKRPSRGGPSSSRRRVVFARRSPSHGRKEASSTPARATKRAALGGGRCGS